MDSEECGWNLRYPFKTVSTQSVEVSADMRRLSAAGNGFLMLFAEGVNGDPGSYVLAGHNHTNGEYQIWTVDGGALTKRASVSASWNSGSRNVAARGSFVPGASNPKKIVVELIIDGVSVLNWQSETGIPAGLGNGVGIWLDDTVAAASPTEFQSVQFKNLIVEESNLPGKLVMIGDSLTFGTGTSNGATKNHGVLAANMLGATIANYSVGGATARK